METVNINKLADFDNLVVKDKAGELNKNEKKVKEKIKTLFYYVRDNIKFGFTKNGDLVKASETIKSGIGQCNNKTTLFLALCKASDIPARIHFSLINRDIQKGIFPYWLFWLLPNQLSHSWLEVEVDGKWLKIDSYINDKDFYENAKKMLTMNGWKTGYSISCSKNDSSPHLNLDKEQFEQMDAVTADHGTWDDPMDYYKTDEYQNRPNIFKSFLYNLFTHYLNKRIEKIRLSDEK